MTPEEFHVLWIEFAPLRPLPPRRADFHLAPRLTHHAVYPEPGDSTVVICGTHDLGAFALALHPVAWLQIRRALAALPHGAFGSRPSRLDPDIGFPDDPALYNMGHTARVDRVDRGRVVLRSATVVDGDRAFLDVRLDAGLAKTLRDVTWGPNAFAELLAEFDRTVSGGGQVGQ